MSETSGFRWVDLSAYGLRLIHQPAPNGSSVLILANAENELALAASLGFARHEKSGLHIRVGAFALQSFLDAFPQAQLVSDGDTLANGGVASSAMFFRGDVRPEQAALPAPVPALAPVAEAAPIVLAPAQTESTPIVDAVAAVLRAPVPERRFLGLNKMGMRVYQEGASRVMMDASGFAGAAPIYHRDRPHTPRGLFLYGSDPISLAAAAEGFVQEMQGGEIQRLDDLRRFTAAIHDVAPDSITEQDPRLVEAMHAIDSALTTWLVSQPANTTMTELFGRARRMAEASGFIASVARWSPEAMATHMPLPLAVAVQRVLGNDQELADRVVSVDGVGSAALLSHLPRSTAVDFLRLPAAEALAIRSLLVDRAARGDEGAPDLYIADLKRELADRPVPNTADLDLTRADLAQMLDSLAQRSEMGRSVFILRPGPESDHDEVEMVRAHVARHYAIEGTVDIDSALVTGVPGTVGARILIVGRRRPEPMSEAPEPAMRLRRVDDWRSLQSWTAEVISNRQKIADYHAALEADDDLDEENRSAAAANSFQTPYVSAAATGQASTMVPRNMEGSIRYALNRLVSAHGDVDQWLANELAVEKDKLGESWSPEQLDAVGLALNAFERNRAILIGDQTGIGKGRSMAALMRWASLQGMKIVFLTEGEVNFSDIYRDIIATGSADEFAPLILNNGARCVDQDGEETLAASPPLLVKAMTHLNHWPDGTRIAAHVLTEEATVRHGAPEVFLLGDDELPEGIEEADIKKSHAWTPSCNLVIASYSQFNKPVERPRRIRARDFKPHAKSQWLRNVVDANTLLVCDEAHNAAGASSNIATNLDAIVGRAGHVVYSSATWAKGVRNMQFYRRLFPETIAVNNLSSVIARGGETMQETLSSMLVKDGVMICREHDLSKVQFEASFDELHLERNIQMMDALAPVLAQMAYVSGDIDERVARMNAALMAQFNRANPEAGQAERRRHAHGFLAARVGFGSPLHTVSRMFMSSLLCEATADRAIEALHNGQKPVILLDATVQGLLDDLVETHGSEYAPTFRDLMRRTLDNLVSVRVDGRLVNMAGENQAADFMENLAERLQLRVTDDVFNQAEGEAPLSPRFIVLGIFETVVQEAHAQNQTLAANAHFTTAINHVRAIVERMPDERDGLVRQLEGLQRVLPANPARAVRHIEQLIDALPDLPISAIDFIRDRIEAAGFSCDEITGRSVQVRDGKIQPRRKRKKVEIKNEFNAGRTDALIINQSGATGIDLHCSPRFKAQGQRVLIAHQLPQDVIKFIQALGRVNRFDQLMGPVVAMMSSGMPAEARLMAMMNTKLRRMSANTTSNRDNANLARNIPDIMNAVGDRVVSQYCAARPDLVARLGMNDGDADQVEDQLDAAQGAINEENLDHKRSANAFLSRVACLLSYDQQKEIIEELEAEYMATLQELDARGENPLKTKHINGRVTNVSKTVFSGVDVENPDSEFDRAVYFEEILIEHAVEPLRGRGVVRLFEQGLAEMGAETPALHAERIRRRREILLAPFRVNGAANIEESIARGSLGAKMQAERFDALCDILDKVGPGTGVTLSVDGGVESGIVTKVLFPRSQAHDHLASHYDVEVVIPGEAQPYRFILGTLMRDANFAIGPGLNQESYEEELAHFDRALEGSSRERRIMLTGNDWEAMSLAITNKLGIMTNYVSESGVRHRGVLVNKGHNTLEFMPVQVTDSMVAARLLEGNGVSFYGSSDLDAASVTVARARNGGGFIVQLPATSNRKYGHIYNSPIIRALADRALAATRAANADAEPAAEGQGARRPRVAAERPRLQVSDERLEAMLRLLIENRVPLFAHSKLRPQVIELQRVIYAERNGIPDEPELALHDQDDEIRPAA